MYSPPSNRNPSTPADRTVSLLSGDGSQPVIPPEIRDLSASIEALSVQINTLIEQREAAMEQRYELMVKLRRGVAGDFDQG